MISAVHSQAEPTTSRLPAEPDATSSAQEIDQLVKSLRHGTVIMKSKFDAMSESDQQLLADGLAAHNLSLYLKPKGHRFPAIYTAVPSIYKDEAASICHVGQVTEGFSISPDDARFRNAGEVEFHVFNATSRVQAKQKLREFLEDLIRIGYFVR